MVGVGQATTGWHTGWQLLSELGASTDPAAGLPASPPGEGAAHTSTQTAVHRCQRVVIVHYGCTSFIYLKPKSQNSLQDRLISVTYTVITPLLNPVVYSLRNKEVKDALCRAIGKNLLLRIFGSLIYSLSYSGYFCNHTHTKLILSFFLYLDRVAQFGGKPKLKN